MEETAQEKFKRTSTAKLSFSFQAHLGEFVIYEQPQFVVEGKLSCQKNRLFSGIIHLLANEDLATLPQRIYPGKIYAALAQFSLFTLKRRKIKSSWLRCTAGSCVCFLVQKVVAAQHQAENLCLFFVGMSWQVPKLDWNSFV